MPGTGCTLGVHEHCLVDTDAAAVTAQPGLLPAIAVAHLVKRFDTVTALNDVSFEVACGSTTALLGGNGAGKTTTISILLGLLTPTAGTVTGCWAR